MFAAEVRRQRLSRMLGIRHWRWHLDEVFVTRRAAWPTLTESSITFGTQWITRASFLESYVTKTRDKAAALRFMRKALERRAQSTTTLTSNAISSTARPTCFAARQPWPRGKTLWPEVQRG